jgi:hypothetical protein
MTARRPKELPDRFPGGHRRGATPVPIPNTVVKPSTADGTAGVTLWESRSLPGVFDTPDAENSIGRSIRTAASPFTRKFQLRDNVDRPATPLSGDNRLSGPIPRQ